LYFPEENLKQLDQNEIIEILNQSKTRHTEWDEAMVNANTEIFEISCEEFVFISSFWKTWKRSGAPKVQVLLQ
jgi:hypothetical protein